MTFAFGDPAADVYASAWPGLVVLFADGAPVAVTQGDVAVEHASVRFDDDGYGFALTFETAGPPVSFEDGDVQLCHVYGTARLAGATREIRGLGQRGHAPESPDWKRITAARDVSAWLEDGSAVALRSLRPAGADYDGEATWAALLGPAGCLGIDEPRLSTTYDDEGRPRRAALELWVGADDAYPRRVTGEVLCGATVDLEALRLDCAFLRWRMDGLTGIGRYDILRRA